MYINVDLNLIESMNLVQDTFSAIVPLFRGGIADSGFPSPGSPEIGVQ